MPVLPGNAIKHTPGFHAVAYHYDAWSRLTNSTLPNGISTVYRYDEYGGVSDIIHYQTAQEQKVISRFTYTYNQDGSIRQRVRINGLGQKAIEQYGYDNDNNLKDYQCSGALCPHDAQEKVISYQNYNFDGFNNIKTVASNNTLTTYEYDQQLPTRLVGYHNSNPAYPRCQKVRYDRNGNILQDDQGNVITYDPLDQTRSVSGKQGTTIYFYNGEGQQVGEGIPSGQTTYFMYGQSNLLNTRAGSQQTSFLYGANRLGKQDDKGIQYYLTDQGQSVVNTVNQIQEQTQNINSYSYSPYGIESDLTKQASNTIPAQYFGFDDQLTDSQTNWQFLGQGYRAYNPMLHRFMSQDSLSPFDKGGINGYVFGSNNSIMIVDPTGHTPIFLGIICFFPFGKLIKAFLSAQHPTINSVADTLFSTALDSLSMVDPVEVLIDFTAQDIEKEIAEQYASAVNNFVMSKVVYSRSGEDNLLVEESRRQTYLKNATKRNMQIYTSHYKRTRAMSKLSDEYANSLLHCRAGDCSMQADIATHLLKKKYPNSYRATIYQKDHAIAILSYKDTKIVVDPWKGVFFPYQEYKEHFFRDAEIRKVW